MENIEIVPTALALVLTVVSPLISAWFTKQTMSSTTKNLIALGVSIVIAVGWVVLNGGFSAGEVAVAMATVYGVQQLVYNQLLKDTAKTIEAHNGVGKDESEVIIEDYVEPDTGVADEK